jgi:hypothetical protein
MLVVLSSNHVTLAERCNDLSSAAVDSWIRLGHGTSFYGTRGANNRKAVAAEAGLLEETVIALGFRPLQGVFRPRQRSVRDEETAVPSCSSTQFHLAYAKLTVENGHVRTSRLTPWWSRFFMTRANNPC